VDEDPIESPDVPAPAVDWFLQQLVDLANDELAKFSITLHSGGLVITGTLISGRTYFREWADEVAQSMVGANTQGTEWLRELLARFGDIYPDRPLDERFEAGEDVQLPRGTHYIHLRDARFLLGAELVPTNRPVLWRGRLAEVDGFILGAISKGEPA
jgi:hypothetical protein